MKDIHKKFIVLGGTLISMLSVGYYTGFQYGQQKSDDMLKDMLLLNSVNLLQGNSTSENQDA